MPRLTLATMNVAEAEQHYAALQHKRHYDALRIRREATRVEGKAHRILRDAYWEADRKAQVYAKPRQRWQLDRAKALKDRYGICAAAGFLKAHGWSLEAVIITLGLPQR